MPRRMFLTRLATLPLAFVLIAAARAELVATFTREGVTDSRLDRFPALSIHQGEPATPFLTPGKFDANWKGKISVPRRQRLVFSFEGEGNANLKIDGKDVLSGEGNLTGAKSKSTRLNPGEHDFDLSYTSKPDGSASFRIYGEEASFPRQTIAPSAFTAEATEATDLGALQRHGRGLVASQSCSKCHTAGTGFGSTPMPETA